MATRCADAGIFVCLHASDSGYDKIAQWWKGPRSEFIAFERDSLAHELSITVDAADHRAAAFVRIRRASVREHNLPRRRFNFDHPRNAR